MTTVNIMFIIGGMLILLFGFFAYKSINIVQPNEIGAKITLGKPERKCDSGLAIVIYPIQTLTKLDKRLMVFKFVVNTIITRKGKVEDYDEPIESTIIDLICTLYAMFDVEEDAVLNSIQYAPGNNAETLGPALIPYVADVIRALGGRLPWTVINQERYYFQRWVLARLVVLNEGYLSVNEKNGFIGFEKEEENANKTLTKEKLERSPFIISRLKNVSLTIEDVCFHDEEIAKSVTAAEKSRLNKKAKITDAEATKQEKIKHGEGDAAARDAMLNIINKYPEFEAIDALKEMARGPSNFYYHLPQDIIKSVSSLLGKKIPL